MKYQSIIIILITMLHVCSCRHADKVLSILNSFSNTEIITLVDSVDLEEYNTMMPSDAIPYDNWFVVQKQRGMNSIDIVNPVNGKKIECLMTGRGPGEVLGLKSIQLRDSLLYAFDISRQNYIVLDLNETITSGEQTLLETITIGNPDVDTENIARHYSLLKCGQQYLAAGIYSDGSWYKLLDSSLNVCGSIPMIEFNGLESLSMLERATLNSTSKFAVRQDNKRGICIMDSGASFSIFSMQDQSIAEIKRNSYYTPGLTPSGVDGLLSPRHSPDDIRGFCDVTSDRQNIYILFSGKKLSNSDDPSFQCRHLLVYDWDGNPVRRYELEKDVCSIHLQGDRLFCASMHPAPRIYIYRL